MLLSTRHARPAPAQNQGQAEEREETRLHTLFTKESKTPRNLKVRESLTSKSDFTVSPGTSLEWRVEMSNRSTQPYELLSIESELTRAFERPTPGGSAGAPRPENPLTHRRPASSPQCRCKW